MRTMPLLIAACSERSSGEFWAHSSSRAARALLVAIVAVEGCSVVMVYSLSKLWSVVENSTKKPTIGSS